MYLYVKELKELIKDCDDDQAVLIATDWANNKFSKLEGVAINMLYDKEAEEEDEGWGIAPIVHDLTDTGYDENDEDWLEIKARGLKVIVLH
jgi:hypothetical protein